ILGLSLPALLTGHLPFFQVAPRGFLLIQKTAVMLFGSSDYALRLLPLVSSLAALFLFSLLSERVLARPAAALFALALFAVQPELIRYGSQVKPYSNDLAVALALTLCAILLWEAEVPTTPWRGLLVGSAGPIAIVLSHAAALVLAGLSIALALSLILSDRRRPFAGVGTTIALWALSAFTAVLMAT